MPIFDRLFDDVPNVPAEPVPRRVLDLDGLIASIEREIHLLLNTRSPLSEDEVDYDNRSVIDYGLVDLSHYYTDSVTDKRRLAQHVGRTIAVFEPRLKRINVTVEGVTRQTGQIDLRIDGDLIFGTVVEPVSFPIRIEGSSGDGTPED